MKDKEQVRRRLETTLKGFVEAIRKCNEEIDRFEDFKEWFLREKVKLRKQLGRL